MSHKLPIDILNISNEDLLNYDGFDCTILYQEASFKSVLDSLKVFSYLYNKKDRDDHEIGNRLKKINLDSYYEKKWPVIYPKENLNSSKKKKNIKYCAICRGHQVKQNERFQAGTNCTRCVLCPYAYSFLIHVLKMDPKKMICPTRIFGSTPGRTTKPECSIRECEIVMCFSNIEKEINPKKIKIHPHYSSSSLVPPFQKESSSLEYENLVPCDSSG